MQFIKNHPIWSALIVVAVLLVIIIITSASGRTTVAEDTIGTLISPVESGVTVATGGIGEWFKGLFGQSQLQLENAQLREEIAQLQAQIALLGDLRNENASLREIANFVEDNPGYDIVTARVTAKNSSYWFDTFTVNAGRNVGIETDMVVMAPEGLVGRVIDVGANWSKVQSIIDSESSVSAMIERTRDIGVVRGSSESSAATGARCNMFYLPFDNDLVPGDTVLTSGLGGVFPRGLIIGEVIEVSRADGTTDRVAVIEPAVDMSSLEEVMIITNSSEVSQ